MSAEPLGFEPIWQAIKGWDIQREHGAGYHGPTGDDVRAILSALAAAGHVIEQDWQPIATAPRDGTRFIAWWQPCEQSPAGGWHECQRAGDGWYHPFLTEPTHWKPPPVDGPYLAAAEETQA